MQLCPLVEIAGAAQKKAVGALSRKLKILDNEGYGLEKGWQTKSLKRSPLLQSFPTLEG